MINKPSRNKATCGWHHDTSSSWTIVEDYVFVLQDSHMIFDYSKKLLGMFILQMGANLKNVFVQYTDFQAVCVRQLEYDGLIISR